MIGSIVKALYEVCYAEYREHNMWWNKLGIS